MLVLLMGELKDMFDYAMVTVYSIMMMLRTFFWEKKKSCKNLDFEGEGKCKGPGPDVREKQPKKWSFRKEKSSFEKIWT